MSKMRKIALLLILVLALSGCTDVEEVTTEPPVTTTEAEIVTLVTEPVIEPERFTVWAEDFAGFLALSFFR